MVGAMAQAGAAAEEPQEAGPAAEGVPGWGAEHVEPEAWEQPVHFEYREVPRKHTLRKLLIGAVVVVALLVGIKACDSSGHLGPPSVPPAATQTYQPPAIPPPAESNQPPSIDVQVYAQRVSSSQTQLQVKLTNGSVAAKDVTIQVMTPQGPLPIDPAIGQANAGGTSFTFSDPGGPFMAPNESLTNDFTINTPGGTFWIQLTGNPTKAQPQGQLNAVPARHMRCTGPSASSPLSGGTTCAVLPGE